MPPKAAAVKPAATMAAAVTPAITATEAAAMVTSATIVAVVAGGLGLDAGQDLPSANSLSAPHQGFQFWQQPRDDALNNNIDRLVSFAGRCEAPWACERPIFVRALQGANSRRYGDQNR
jgi:hypothetical protein